MTVTDRWLKKEAKKIIAIFDKKVEAGYMTKELLFPTIYTYKMNTGYEMIAINIELPYTKHKVNTFYVTKNQIVASTNLLTKKGKVRMRTFEDVPIFLRKQLSIRPLPFVYNT